MRDMWRGCFDCGQTNMDLMVNQPRSPDGKGSYCRRCNAIRRARAKAANPGRHEAYMAKWQAANPGKGLANALEWARNNPERAAVNKVNYRLRDLARARAQAILSQAVRRAKLSGTACTPTRRKDLDELPRTCPCGAPGTDLDHIVPVAAGGCANVHNFQFLCGPCNRAKSAKLPPNGTGCPVFWEQQEESP